MHSQARGMLRMQSYGNTDIIIDISTHDRALLHFHLRKFEARKKQNLIKKTKEVLNNRVSALLYNSASGLWDVSGIWYTLPHVSHSIETKQT